MLFFAWTVILLYSLGIKTSLAWASQIIVLGCKLKDLLVLIHCVRRRYFYLLLTKLFSSWCFHLLFTLLVRKNLYLIIITSFSQYTTICFVSILYSVFNEHLCTFVLVGPSGLEPPTSCLSGTRSNLLSYDPSGLVSVFFSLGWWRWWDSNPWPPACRAGALPAELHPHFVGCLLFSVFKDPQGRPCAVFRLRFVPSFLYVRPFFFWSFLKILKNWTKKCKRLRSSCFGIYLVLRYFRFSIERRWSSRTFRYGYLVTT